MSATVEYSSDRASAAQVAAHLSDCDADFVPSLSSRAEIGEYARKIFDNAVRFEAWSCDTLIGLVAVYCNDMENRIAFITSVSVQKAWMGRGVAASLMKHCIAHAKAMGIRRIMLEVAGDNVPAIRLYVKMGFVVDGAVKPSGNMLLCLEIGE